MPRTNEAVLAAADTNKQSMGSPAPVPKFGLSRRQRRSHLKRMAQENRRYSVDPAERGRRSGRKARTSVDRDAEGFEDVSDFFASPATNRMSTDIESPLETSGDDTDRDGAQVPSSRAEGASVESESAADDAARRELFANGAGSTSSDPSVNNEVRATSFTSDQSPIKSNSPDASMMSPEGSQMNLSTSSSSSSAKSFSPPDQSDSETSAMPSSSSEDDTMMSEAQDQSALVNSPSADNSLLDRSDFSPQTAGRSAADSTRKRMEAAANAMESPIRQPGLRRSKRVRVKPLEYWKNERIVYERTNDGLGQVLPVAKGIERLSKPTPAKKPRKKRRVGYEPIVLPEDVETEMPSIEIDLGDDRTAQVELVKRAENLAFQSLPCSTSENETKNGEKAETRAAAAFIHDTLRTGVVELRPEAVKDPESSGDAAQLFHVHRCAEKGVLVTINNKKTQVSPGDIFLVPPKSFYEIQNLSLKTPAQLYYTVVDVVASV